MIVPLAYPSEGAKKASIGRLRGRGGTGASGRRGVPEDWGGGAYALSLAGQVRELMPDQAGKRNEDGQTAKTVLEVLHGMLAL